MGRGDVLVVALALTTLTGLLLAGHGPWAGGVIVSVFGNHGLNRGDVPVLVLWIAGMCGCWRLWRGAGPR